MVICSLEKNLKQVYPDFLLGKKMIQGFFIFVLFTFMRAAILDVVTCQGVYTKHCKSSLSS